MPAFERTPTKFVNQGMDVNHPADQIPDGQYQILCNVRSYQQGRIESRPGMTLIDNSFGGDTHSGYTLNDFNPDTAGGTKRFAGAGTSLYWADPGASPTAYTAIDTGYSGNPLSMVAFRPDATSGPWLYVGDSAQMRKYSTSFLTGGTPTPYPIGVSPPNVAPSVSATTGSLTGSYQWRYTYKELATGSISNPGPPNYAVLTLSGQGATMTLPGVSPLYSVQVWRFGGTVNQWKLVGEGLGFTAFVDNVSDAILLNAPLLDFNRWQPFPVLDIPRTGGATSAAATPGTNGNGSVLTLTAGSSFNVNWPEGTIFNFNQIDYTIRRVISVNSLELNEDAGVQVNKDWLVSSGIIQGQPLQCLWGPYQGQDSGLFMFGCGDPKNPGVLYWANGNDPDSTALENSYEVTSPSEPLMNGCVYDNRPYVWSTENLYVIVPTTQGQFIALKVPGGRGLWAKWGHAEGDQMYWIGKDGIYASVGGAANSITDAQLYPAFPHDNQPGYGFTFYDPADPLHPYVVNPPIPISGPLDGNMPLQRLSWGDGILYFDYQEYTTNFAKSWVYDTRETHGWCMDVPLGSLKDGGFVAPLWRYWEESYHSMMVGLGTSIYLFTGVSDAGATITCNVRTKAYSYGDLRTQKLFGDAMLDANAQAAALTAYLLGAGYNSTTGTLTPNGAILGGPYSLAATSEAQLLMDVNNGQGALDSSIGLDLTWAANAQTVYLYEWQPSYVPKPPFTGKRATDWTDDGNPSAKFLKGCILTANVSSVTGSDLTVAVGNNLQVTSATHPFVAGDVSSILQVTQGANWTQGSYYVLSVVGGAAFLDRSPAATGTSGGSYALGGNRSVLVESDDGSSRAITISHPGQTEYPYSFAPIIGCHQMRVRPTDTKTCEIFSVMWIYETYPEFSTLVDNYQLIPSGGVGYVRGVAIEGDSRGEAVNLAAQADQSAFNITIPVNQNGQTLTFYGFATPFRAQEIRLIPLGNWSKKSVRWIFDPYPDYVQAFTSWENTGSDGVKNVRGGRIHVDNRNVQVIATLWADNIATAFTVTIPASTGEQVIPFAFYPPLNANLLRWLPNAAWSYFRTEWIADPYPDLDTLVSPWINLGYQGAKFVQGVRLTADTNNVPVSFQILYEGGGIGATIPATAFTDKETIPFSFNPPFYAHNLRIRPLGAARIFLDETQWVWEPAPELVTSWITPPMTHGMTGYWHSREGYIAMISSAAVTFTISSDNVPVAYTIPSTNGLYAKQYLPFQPKKGKSATYSAVSSLPFRLYLQDCEIRSKAWGESGPYRVVKPIGDSSVVDGARI